jgi:hypothetical protein
MDYNKRSQHEDSCPFLPVECLAGEGKTEVAKCGWRGKKSELLDHVTLVHGLSMIHTEQPIEDSKSGWSTFNFMKVTLVCTLGELFWLTVKVDAERNKRLEVVQYVGSVRKATQFEYIHELHSLDGRTVISFLSTTRSCFEDISAVLASKHCFHIDIDSFAKIFVNSLKRVPGYKLVIREALQTKD